MKNLIRSIAILAVVGSIVPFASAAKNPSCPSCKMVLSSKKDKMHSVAVKIKGKTYFCCGGCAMNKKAAPKKGPTHKAH